MAARCTGCWCTRTLERELPPVAERHGGSSRTAAAATCQRAGGYGAGLGTLAAAAAALVMARGGWTAPRSKVASPRVRSARPKRLRAALIVTLYLTPPRVSSSPLGLGAWGWRCAT